jgi:hypothetical protein
MATRLQPCTNIARLDVPVSLLVVPLSLSSLGHIYRATSCKFPLLRVVFDLTGQLLLSLVTQFIEEYTSRLKISRHNRDADQ